MKKKTDHKKDKPKEKMKNLYKTIGLDIISLVNP